MSPEAKESIALGRLEVQRLMGKKCLEHPEAARGQVGREGGRSFQRRLEPCLPGWGVWILFQAQCEAIEGFCNSQ